MKNPLIKLVTITDVPTLLFKGTGNVAINGHSGSGFQIGDSEVEYSSADHTFGVGPYHTFNAPAKLYAVCDTGQTAVAKVMVWY